MTWRAPPFMSTKPADDMAEASDLTNEELGALVRLKWALWRAGGVLSHDGTMLARVTRAGRRWGAIAAAVLAKLKVGDGKVSHHAVEDAIVRAENLSGRGKKAADGRWKTPAGKSPRSAANSEFRGRLNSYNLLKNNDPADARAMPTIISKSTLTSTSSVSPRARPVDNSRGLGEEGSSREAASNEALSQLLFEQGAESLMERARLPRKAAVAQIHRWFAAVGADGEELARFIAGAEQENLFGPNFIGAIEASVNAYAVARERGGSFNFGLVPVKGGKGAA